jgi:hypothetical protein
MNRTSPTRIATLILSFALAAFMPATTLAASAFTTSSKTVTTGKVSYELFIPEHSGGDYLVFIVNPLLTNMPGGELNYLMVVPGFTGTRVVGGLDLTKEHVTDPNGTEHWYKLPPGKYALSVALYDSNPFVGTSGMTYRSPAPRPTRIIYGPTITVPGALVTLH